MKIVDNRLPVVITIYNIKPGETFYYQYSHWMKTDTLREAVNISSGRKATFGDNEARMVPTNGKFVLEGFSPCSEKQED